MLWLMMLACTRGDGAGELALPGGAAVVLLADGDLELRVDGRRTLALAGGVEVRSFTEDVEGNLGQWRFTRGDVDVTSRRFTEVRRRGSTIEVGLAGGGQLSLTDDGPGRTRIRVEASGGDAIAVPVRCDADSTFHGFGEQYHTVDQRGEAFTLLVSEQGIGRDGSVPFFSGDRHTTYFPMPYWLDARGFGVLVDTDYRVEVDLCASDPELAWVEVVNGEPVEWVLLHGDTPLDVVRQLGDLVGRPTAPPAWALGTWVCTQGGAEAVLAQADQLLAEAIPVTALWVQDWTGGAVNIGGGYGVNYRWEAEEGVPELVEALHGRGFRVLGYMNPFVDPGLPNHYDEMLAAGMLPTTADGEPYLFFGPRGSMTQADLTNPATQDYIRDHLIAAVEEVGLDGWMADFAEWLPLDAVVHDGSDGVVAHNRAPEAWQRLTREAMAVARPDGDWVMFARSGWTGVQAVAQIHWAGDQEADFSATDGLPTVVPAMLTMGLSGQPFTTHDVAGFSGGPSTPELYRRWIELGAFTPIFRTHDGNERDANWRYDTDADTLAFFRRFARIHDALRPELEAAAAEAAETGAPMVRALLLDHPDDREAWSISDQYRLGAFLVAPVVDEGATTRGLYLPEGEWFHVWTGDVHAGPGWVTVDAPLGEPPVFHLGSDRPDLRAISSAR
jgi:alpha-glucosidase